MRFDHLGQVICFTLAALCAGSALAQVPANAQREIDHLLDYIARPDCQFNRNGTWYDGKTAKSHLKQKYDELAKRKLVPNSEAFIERAASVSSMSGVAYQVRCAGAAATPSGPWLAAELQRYRRSAPATP
jgi:hypothetical protein